MLKECVAVGITTSFKGLRIHLATVFQQKEQYMSPLGLALAFIPCTATVPAFAQNASDFMIFVNGTPANEQGNRVKE
jgi:hypothetical protein